MTFPTVRSCPYFIPYIFHGCGNYPKYKNYYKFKHQKPIFKPTMKKYNNEQEHKVVYQVCISKEFVHQMKRILTYFGHKNEQHYIGRSYHILALIKLNVMESKLHESFHKSFHKDPPSKEPS